jgi:CspA family cold shock protein
MPTGKVVWFDTVRGYGFIKPDSGEDEVIVHVRDLEKADLPALFEGQSVSFVIRPSLYNGKPAAYKIRVAEG